MQLVTILPDNKIVVVIPKHQSLGDKTVNNNNTGLISWYL